MFSFDVRMSFLNSSVNDFIFSKSYSESVGNFDFLLGVLDVLVESHDVNLECSLVNFSNERSFSISDGRYFISVFLDSSIDLNNFPIFYNYLIELYDSNVFNYFRIGDSNVFI